MSPETENPERTLLEQGVSLPGGRARRLMQGWLANLLLMLLGILQQVALIPIFLKFWSSDTLAAWLSLCAVGNLIPVADLGLQLRSINRFLALRSRPGGDDQTANFYASILAVYLALIALLAILLGIALVLFPPSISLGYHSVPDFDASLALMTLGMLVSIVGNPPTALYRARGLYARAVGLQCVAMLVGQLGQIAAIVTTGSLTAVTLAYVGVQVLVSVYLVTVDAPKTFPYLRRGRMLTSWAWVVGQFRRSFSFAAASLADLVLVNAPILLVSALVADRIVVAQWGLTRVVAGLVRATCVLVSQPLAAELGHDFAVGDRDKLSTLYARGSVLVSVLAATIVSGVLAFWPDFFVLWTHGAIPYDPRLTVTLLIGAVATAPSILAGNYAIYSNRGALLASIKGAQLALFLVLAVAGGAYAGVIGVAVALVCSELTTQLGWLSTNIVSRTLDRPVVHLAFLAVITCATTLVGYGLGVLISAAVPGSGALHFFLECALWLAAVAGISLPLWKEKARHAFAGAIPR
ncbi:hypothetical protein MTR72_39025 [Bradyrhizobium sp. ISRA442]|uniref:lipopolysaccharide biosynthesis protein n=1 Tax=Bradyrhizobium sp. ISRA442 TaxID=2866197 RepID=UPI00311B2AAC